MDDFIEQIELSALINKARKIVEDFEASRSKSNLYHYINTYHDPAHFNDFIGKTRDAIEGELKGNSDDLDARLIKQAQSLDCLFDYFVLRSQSTEDILEENRRINFALRAQDQSARTIEKFKKLRKMRAQIEDQTSINPEQTSKKASDASVD